MDSKDFKVVDKRRFAKTGEDQGAEADKAQAEKSKESSTTAPPQAPGVVPPVDFSTLILSLSTSALLHLGEIPDPQTQKMNKNLELAKHTVDMIDMLKQKTRGNLTEAESGLIDHVLYDLRMRYINASKG